MEDCGGVKSGRVVMDGCMEGFGVDVWCKKEKSGDGRSLTAYINILVMMRYFGER